MRFILFLFNSLGTLLKTAETGMNRRSKFFEFIAKQIISKNQEKLAD
jgi:hypothetical protein